MAKISRVMVTFRLAGDTLDPKLATQRLGIAPSHAHARGEHRGTQSGRDYY
jgi:hypothetical protein